jgi:hypothetical protein
MPGPLAGSPEMGDERLNGRTRLSASTIMPIDLSSSSEFSKELPRRKNDLEVPLSGQYFTFDRKL